MFLVKCIKSVSMTVCHSNQFYLLYERLTYKLAKVFVPILEPFTKTNTLKYSFNFATEIVEQDSCNFMGGLDID